MPEQFGDLFEAETAKNPVFYFDKKVKTKDGEVERKFVSVFGVELAVNSEGKGTQFEEDEFRDFSLDDEVTRKLLTTYAKSIKLNQPPLIEGETDIGKSKALEYLAFLTNNHLLYQSFSGQTDVTELIGKYVPNIEDKRKTFERVLSNKDRGTLKPETVEILRKTKEGKDIRSLTIEECEKIAELEGLNLGNVNWVWQDGTVPKAMKFDGGLGCWLYFDELGAAEPQILVKLNRIFARGLKRLEITENGGREIFGGENFRLMATTNPPDYAGREPFEKDFLRRWVYQKMSRLSQSDFERRLNFISKNNGQDQETIVDGEVNLLRVESVDILVNSVIAMFAFNAQEYWDKVPKDSGEQEFRLRDFTDAIRVREYMEVMQGDDLVDSLTEAIDFYYLNKIDDEKKDTNSNDVKDEVLKILNTIIDQMNFRETIEKEKTKLLSPELIEQQEQLEREKTKLKNLEIEVLDGLDLNTRKKRKKKRKRKSEITSGENILSFESKSGEPLEYDLDEILEKSEKFYEKEGIDWVEVPESIELDGEQRVEAIRIIEALCPTGDYENVTITYIPEGLADNEEKRRKLLEKTTEGYYTGDEEGKKDYWESDNFKERGGIEGIEDKETKGRLLITKTTKELKDDELFKQTLGKTAEELMGERGIMQETGLRGLGLSELLVIQRQRYNEDVEHMDEESWIWITEIEATPSSLVPDVDWASNDAQFYLHAFTPDYNFEHLGCRLAGSLKV